MCPIDLSRIVVYSREFESLIPKKISEVNLNKSKEDVLSARASFDSMVATLIQLLHNREILEKEEDKILFGWMTDNLSRYLKRLDDEEFNLVVKFDEPNKDVSRVGVSRISAYAKLLITSSNILIYESLLKATEEYSQIKEKKPRYFLYILFQVFQLTLSVFGGLPREGIKGIRKSAIQTFPISYSSLLGNKGQEIIRKGYEEETGVDINKYKKTLKDLQDSGEDFVDSLAEDFEESKDGEGEGL